MRQIPLDISSPAPPTLDNFVAGRNAQLLALLREVEQGICTEHFITLWGEPGSGRRHLLQALAGTHTIAPGQMVQCDGRTLVHDVGALDATGQQTLFNRYNEIRASGQGTLIVSAACAPLQLPLREDLRTRLGWGLVFQVIGLSDEEKAAALYNQARARGLQLSSDIIPWLLTHTRRDMPALMALLDALDRYSLEKKRAITLPLVRELLNSEKQN
ncbi:MAG: DnaA regulatory inactivator Hda [Burkholderiaceae bacterium]|nr:MAG: DnaA regulatory inactivator Hda [Burkholderiaceae bacterium]